MATRQERHKLLAETLVVFLPKVILGSPVQPVLSSPVRTGLRKAFPFSQQRSWVGAGRVTLVPLSSAYRSGSPGVLAFTLV